MRGAQIVPETKFYVALIQAIFGKYPEDNERARCQGGPPIGLSSITLPRCQKAQQAAFLDFI